MKRLLITVGLVGSMLVCVGDERGKAADLKNLLPTSQEDFPSPISVTAREPNTGSRLSNSLAQNSRPASPTTHGRPTERRTLSYGQARVTVQEVQATLSDGYSRLDIRLQLHGKEYEGVSSFRCRLTKAVDDTGANLLPPQGFFDPKTFSPMPWFALELPARRALTLKELSGVLEVLLVDRDPQATVKVTGFIGKSRLDVSHPSLTATGVKLAVVSNAEFDRINAQQPNLDSTYIEKQGVGPAFNHTSAARRAFNGSRLVVLQNDPNHCIVEIKFSSPSGEVIPYHLSSRHAFLDPRVWAHYFVYNFDRELPDTTVMKIFVATRKAVATVPFSFKDVPLP